MQKPSFTRAALLGGALALLATPSASQKSSAPIARYTMDAGTMSGMAAMGGGGPDMGAMMGQAGNEDTGDEPAQPRKKKKCGGGLGGMLAGAMGAGC